MSKTNGVPNPAYNYGSKDEHSKVDMESSHYERAATITGHNIVYTVDVKTKPCCGQIEKKEILKGINGVFKPGMNAILGPTGSGKSSLLDILAGRKDPAGLHGQLLLDGSPPPENFKCMVGYVVQDDVVMGGLTVRENFEFSATLRLPSHVTKADRKDRVDNVINELGLNKCADTKVGNEFFRGVSGGERKRTNIGMELIISPPVLFLDEPTTGLDANTANSVMMLLRRLALKGRTVVFSIHQPRYSIFKLFDSLMLLSMGECVYHGPASESLEYFKSIGYVIEEHNNPPDFFLDVINGEANHSEKDINEISVKDIEEVHTKLVSSFQKSTLNSRLQNQMNPILQQYQHAVETNTVKVLPKIEYATSAFTQFRAVSGRTILNLLRNPQLSVMQWLVLIIFGLIVGAIYWQLEKDCVTGIQNRVGAFFFIIMNQVFGNLSAVELFIKERSIFMHENVSGFYRVSAYFFSKIICDVIPMRLIPVILFSAVTYFMLGLRLAAENFFLYVLSLFLVAMSASGIAFFFSATVSIFAVANLCIALTYVFMMVFSGLLVNVSSVPSWLRWLKWASLFRYGLNALDINELKDMTFSNGTATCSATGNDYLIDQNIPYQTSWDFWQNIVALGAMSVISMTGTYIQLRRMKKLR
ncbi:broad substrate specificity ATP-binding cassette transporter ABCG2-like isoform X1 [Mytilus edulis]|uniref:broad substrate specificity ATP-binding cassette transporter ABCG2-like isoform X1 n=1 Tax=Mytilus edulis TaxID=6550 RepID=UPI0039EFB27F